MSHVFSRARGQELPRVDHADGAWIVDTAGRRYLDGSGGAIVVGIGHGDAGVVSALEAQERRVAYVHATDFTSEALEAYASELAPLLPVDEPRIYPVSGGSEAVETALKMARAYHLARGEAGRHKVIARIGSYHGNTIGALDASWRQPLRGPYEPWLGRVAHVSPAYEYRCSNPGHPVSCGKYLSEELEQTILAIGPENVACFIAEPISGATLGAAVPPDDYWPAVAQVCRRHGVLLIADEVMTGFGRSGTWFGVDQWGVRPDILVAGKGATSGYWPFGLAVASGSVYDVIVAAGGFVHGFTFSHSAPGAAVAREVLHRLEDGKLVAASRDKGDRLRRRLVTELSDVPLVGDIRGRGLMIGIELVADPASKAPFPRERQVAERVTAAAKERGLLVYFSVGGVDGTDGDLLMLGPPFVTSDEDLDYAAAVVHEALQAVRPA